MTTTTTTTTIYEQENVDCIESQAECTAACEAASARNYVLATAAVKNGRACVGATDCQPGEGMCPVPKAEAMPAWTWVQRGGESIQDNTTAGTAIASIVPAQDEFAALLWSKSPRFTLAGAGTGRARGRRQAPIGDAEAATTHTALANATAGVAGEIVDKELGTEEEKVIVLCHVHVAQSAQLL